MKKLKVMTVVGTRPEIIRLSRVLAALDMSPSIEHISVHTGQNYDFELNEIFYSDLEIRVPNYFLNAAGANASETIGLIIIKIDALIEELKPDAFLILGDTNSCLCSIPAKKRKIPIFHMEAGNRCFDQRVPEEINRKIVDHISDINLTYSDIAREYLLREGLSPDRIIKTGSPMFEVLKYYEKQILSSIILEKLNLKREKYIVVSAHREENISNDKKFLQFLKSLTLITNRYSYPLIVSTHPRTKKRLNDYNDSCVDEELKQEIINVNSNPLIMFNKPLGFFDYIFLQKNSFAVLSDSGTISEESSILNFRALNIRESHERPEAMEETSVIMVGLDSTRIIQGLLHITQNSPKNTLSEQSNSFALRNVSDYSMPNVSEKIVRIILSYTDYVNRVVWNK